MPEPRQVAPTLELISPVLPGRLFELNRDLVRIGRDPSSDICLNRKDVSWAHAWVFRRPEGFFVEDRQSRNGTYLDGGKLDAKAPAPLRDGDRIKICDNLLVFRRHAVRLDEETGSSTILGMLDNLTSLDVVSSVAKPEDVLRAVLEINSTLGGTIELNEALGKTLDALFGIFRQADRGFILTLEPDGDLSPRAIRQRNGGGNQLVLSQTMLTHVMKQGQGLIGVDAQVEGAGASGQRTVLCVPLLDRAGQPIGIIQLESRPRPAAFRGDDLDLLAAVAVPIAVAVENNRLLRTKAEWAAAGEIQRALLPRRQPSARDYESWEHYEPAMEVGGDYYDYIPLEPTEPAPGVSWSRWAVAAGDVVGKGMPAALLMSSLSSEVRHGVRIEPDPARVVDRLNRHFFDAEILDRFITFLLIVVDAEAHRITVVNAGHLAPVIRKADGGILRIGEEESGPPLGVVADPDFRAVNVDLGPGDVVLLYTDGVSEALGAQNRLFGVDAILKTLAEAPPRAAEVGEALLKAVRSHALGRPQSDDIAIVSFSRIR
jgi:serine phosphatase RsbU (regulator of sigma subunit)/pSer/pThr/pTyr-binding forkhead associated (FHA) protein